MKISRLTFATIVCALMLGAFSGHAVTNGFINVPFRGSANSEAGYWESFNVPVGAPGNSPDKPGATTGAVLTQFETNATMAGSGNLYNQAGISSFELVDSTPFALGTLVLQIRAVGSELNYTSMLLTYSNASGAHSLAPLFRYELNRAVAQGQGIAVSSLWQWDLSVLGISNYTVAFHAGGESLSFDSMTLDSASLFTKAFPQQLFNAQSAVADLARWMYPFNADPAGRPTASVFGALGNAPDFDSRDAQYLLGWNTTNHVPAGQGARNYLLRRARVTLTIATGSNTYTGTLRDYRTYLPTNDSRYLPPSTTAYPTELFGAAFRGSYSSTNFPQDGPFFLDPDGGFVTNRIVYAAGFDTNGGLIDISNNVGDDGTNELITPFEIAPFAVGQTTNVAPGQAMLTGTTVKFDLNLNDPLIYGYVQEGLNVGNLSFMVASLVPASRGGVIRYPNFYTIFSSLAESNQMPLLDIEGEVMRLNLDSDADGLSDDWENFYFGSLANVATNDFDADGLNNMGEYRAGTIPTMSSNVLQLFSIQHRSTTNELRFAHAPARQYSISWSDDLQTWQTNTNPPLIYSSAWLAKTGTNLAYPSPVFAVWRDTSATNQQRFYRVGTR